MAEMNLVGCYVNDHIGDGAHPVDAVMMVMEKFGLTKQQVRDAYYKEFNCTPEQAAESMDSGEDQ